MCDPPVGVTAIEIDYGIFEMFTSNELKMAVNRRYMSVQPQLTWRGNLRRRTQFPSKAFY